MKRIQFQLILTDSSTKNAAFQFKLFLIFYLKIVVLALGTTFVFPFQYFIF